jgi:citrate lyase subunit beta/citryl-CoA lyase
MRIHASLPPGGAAGHQMGSIVERSWLFIPGESERKKEQAAGSGADVIIFGLEDPGAAERRPVARSLILDYLKSHPERSAQKL